MPGNGAKRKAEPRKVKAGSRRDQIALLRLQSGGEREKELRREKLDLPGREICPNKSGARAGDSVRDQPG